MDEELDKARELAYQTTKHGMTVHQASNLLMDMEKKDFSLESRVRILEIILAKSLLIM